MDHVGSIAARRRGGQRPQASTVRGSQAARPAFARRANVPSVAPGAGTDGSTPTTRPDGGAGLRPCLSPYAHAARGYRVGDLGAESLIWLASTRQSRRRCWTQRARATYPGCSRTRANFHDHFDMRFRLGVRLVARNPIGPPEIKAGPTKIDAGFCRWMAIRLSRCWRR